MAKKFKEMPGWLTGKKEEVPYWKQQLEEDFAAKREARAELFRQQREEFSNQHTYDHEGGTKIIPTQPASTTTSKPAPTSGAGQSYSIPTSYTQFVDNIAGDIVTPLSPTADKFANKFKVSLQSPLAPGQSVLDYGNQLRTGSPLKSGQSVVDYGQDLRNGKGQVPNDIKPGQTAEPIVPDKYKLAMQNKRQGILDGINQIAIDADVNPDINTFVAGTVAKGLLGPVKGVVSTAETMRDIQDLDKSPAYLAAKYRGNKPDATGGLNKVTEIVNNATGYEKMSDTAKFFSDVGSSIPQTALNFIPGYGQVMFGVSAAGNYMDEAKQKGEQDPRKRFAYGVIGGTAEVALNEALGVIPGYKKLFSDAFRFGAVKEMGKKTGKDLLKLGAEYLRQGGKEAIEEMAIDPVMGLTEKALLDPNKPWWGENGVIDLKQMSYDGLAGLTMGGFMDLPAFAGQTSNIINAKKYMDNNYPAALSYASALPDGSKAKEMAKTLMEKGNDVTVGEVSDLMNMTKQDYADLMMKTAKENGMPETGASTPQEMGELNRSESLEQQKDAKPIVGEASNKATQNISQEDMDGYTKWAGEYVKEKDEKISNYQNQLDALTSIKRPTKQQKKDIANLKDRIGIYIDERTQVLKNVEDMKSGNIKSNIAQENISGNSEVAADADRFGGEAKDTVNKGDAPGTQGQGRVQPKVIGSNGRYNTTQEITRTFERGIQEITQRSKGARPNARMVEAETDVEKGTQKMMQKLGMDVVYYESDSKFGEDEFVHNSNSSIIFVKKSSKAKDATFYAGHGFFHTLKTNHSDLYKQVVDAVGSDITDAQVDRYKNTFKDKAYRDSLTRDDVIEEMLADRAGNIFTDKSFWQNVMARSKELFNKLVKVAKKMFKQLEGSKEYVDFLSPDQAEAMRIKFENIVSEVADRVAEGYTLTDVQIRDAGADPLNIKSLGQVVTKFGNVVAPEVAKAMEEGNYQKPKDIDAETKYSVRTMPEWEKTFKEKATEIGIDKDTQDKIVKQAYEIGRVFMERPDLIRAKKTKKSGMGPLRKNVEYTFTLDFDTTCTRTLQFRSNLEEIERRIKRPLNETESRNLIEYMRAVGQMIPCVYCYVETKRMLMQDSYIAYNTYRNNVMDALDKGLTGEQLEGTMYGWNEKKKELTDASTEKLAQWKAEHTRQDGVKQSSVEGIWTGYNSAKIALQDYMDFKYEDFDADNLFASKVKEDALKWLGIDEKSDKVAAAEVGDIVAEWMYDKLANIPHTQLINRADMVPINTQYLTLHRDAMAYSKSASSAKGVDNYEEYINQLYDVSVEDKKNMNAQGGIRKHSSNDFRVDHIADYFQFFADAAADKRGGFGWYGHTYTKSPLYVEIFAPTHDMINMSIAFNGDTYETLRENVEEGFAWAEARRLRQRYKNAGTMAMVTNDAQLKYALEADWIDMIIPFHASGMKKEVYNNLLKWIDYTSKQNETWFSASDMKARLEEKGIEVPKGAKSDEIGKLFNDNFKITKLEYVNDKGETVTIKPHFLVRDQVEHGLTIPGHNNDVKRYKQLCEEYGVNPRFHKHEMDLGDGKKLRVTDHPGYLKLIKEAARTDTPQEYLTADIDWDAADRIIREWQQTNGGKGGYSYEKQFDEGYVRQFIKEYINQGERPLGWLSDDAQYMLENRQEDIKKLQESKSESFAKNIPVPTIDYDSLPRAKYSSREKQEWIPSLTAQQVKERFPEVFTLNADEATEDTNRNPTQIANTKSTYEQLFRFLQNNRHTGTVLDASSGLGYGTQVGKDMEFDIEDLEPFPDKNYNPKYRNYKDVKKQYDTVISSFVLNVIPQDIRNSVVKDIGRFMKDGGKAYILTRGADVKEAKGKVAINEAGMEYYMPGKKSYQKGFTNPELKAYLEDTLGDGYKVETISKANSGLNGKVGAVVTKTGGKYSSRDKEEAAKKHFGTTTNFNEAGYILDDGTILDFSGKREGGPSNVRYMDHRDIQDIYDDLERTDAMVDFIRRGNIRLMPEKGGVDMAKKPEGKQRSALRRYIVSQNGYVILDLENSDGKTANIEYDKGTKADRILNDIDKYFDTGNVSKDTIADFHTSFSSRNKTDTPEFKKWFGSSVVADENGKPLKLYHGTGSDFTVFDVKDNKSTQYGPGIYLTDSKYYAGEWAKERSSSKPVTMELYAKIERPYDEENFNPRSEEGKKLRSILIDKYHIDLKRVNNIFREENRSVFDSLKMFLPKDDTGIFGNASKANEVLREAGYDGIIAKFRDTKQWVAFEPTQVKSVDNVGTFDANNPDIRYSSRDKEEILYHGTSNAMLDIPTKNKYGDSIVFLSQNEDVAKAYIGKNGKVVKLRIDPEANIVDATGNMDNMDFHMPTKTMWNKLLQIAKKKNIDLGHGEYKFSRDNPLTYESMISFGMDVLSSPFNVADKDTLDIFREAGIDGFKILEISNNVENDAKKRGSKIPDLKSLGEYVDATVIINPDVISKYSSRDKEDVAGAKDLPEGEKPRRFANNAANAGVTPTRMRDRLLDSTIGYKPITNDDTWNEVWPYVDASPEDALTDFRRIENLKSAEDTALGEALIMKSIQDDNLDLAIELTAELASKLTTAGQIVQAASILKRLTPEGMLIFADRQLRQDQPADKMPEIGQDAQKVADSMNKANEGAIDEVVDEVEDNLGEIVPGLADEFRTPSEEVTEEGEEEDERDAAEILAKKIINTAKDPKQKNADILMDMVNTLFKVAQESPLPEHPSQARDAIEFVADAIERRSEYKDVWNRAKEIVKAEYEDNQDALDLLEEYFDKGIKRTFPTKQLNRAVQKGMKELGIKIADIVRQHYKVNSKARTDLVNKLVKEAGLSGTEAKILEHYVRNRMKDLTKAAKESSLKRIFANRPKAVRRSLIDRMMELSNLGAYDNANYRSAIGDKLGIPMLTSDLAKYISVNMKRIQGMKDGREKDVEVAKVLAKIDEKRPRTLARKISTFQTIMQLLNTKTAVRNFSGNLMFGMLDNVANAIGVPVDFVISKLTRKPRTTLFPSITKQFKAGKRGLKESVEDAVLGIDTKGMNKKYQLGQGRTFKKETLLGKMETAMNITLKATDGAFYEAAKDESLRQQMKIAGVDKPTPGMIEIAEQLANYRTFQDDTMLSQGFSALKKALNKISAFFTRTEEFGLGDLVLKYPKTPANILARAIEFSPAGGLKALAEVCKPLVGRQFNQKTFVDTLSRSVTGTMLIAVGYLLFKLGILTGRADDDKDVAAMQRDMGYGEYKINLTALARAITGGDPKTQKGDFTASYDWMQPNSIMIGIGANIGQDKGTDTDLLVAISDAAVSGMNTLFEQPLLQGIKRFTGGYDLPSNVMQTLYGMPASFVPSSLNQLKQLTDNTTRSTYDPSGLGEIAKSVGAKVPGLSLTMQPRVSTSGEDMQAYKGEGWQNNPLNVMMNPAYTSTYNPTPAQEMVMDIYEKTGSKIQFPRLVENYIKWKGEKINLTPEEVTEWQRYVGKETTKRFNQYANNSGFRSQDPEDQAKELEKILTEITKEGKKVTIIDPRGLK